MSALSEALHQANRQGLSARQISAEARRRGHTLSHATVAKYLGGNHAQPDEATLQGLADALATNVRTLRQAAGIVTDDHEPLKVPAEAARLTRRQKDAVLEVINSMLDPGRASNDLDVNEISAKGSFGSTQAKPPARPRRRKGA